MLKAAVSRVEALETELENTKKVTVDLHLSAGLLMTIDTMVWCVTEHICFV